MKTSILVFLIIALTPISAFSQPFTSESQWETFFQSNIQSLDPIEGVWSNTNTKKFFDSRNRLLDEVYSPQAEKIAIYKSGSTYIVYDFDFDMSYYNRSFQNTANTGIYLYECFYAESNSTAYANAILTANGLLEFSYEKPTSQFKKEIGSLYQNGLKLIYENKWIKLSPKVDNHSIKKKSSGTGFAISSNGIIVTNYHVIDGATSIKVRGIKSDFNKTFKARVLVTDKNNDLALIQIDDYSFTSLGAIPFTIKTNLSGVGENIFVLGYPLRATMGDEIKLTNGIVSSKTGFQGDITSYQISAPVQPGNSGGPLFDNQGNIIGIINAKHMGAENASYGIKSSYLTGLIESLPSPPKLQTVNLLNGKTLTQQVELVKKVVYIIETE
jgi:S1-C subfamily serine protease